MEVNDKGRIYHKAGGDTISYEISDEKVKAADSNIWYFGFLANGGAWIIMEDNRTNGTYRYLAGKTGYAANFTARESLTYKYFSEIG